MKVHSVLKLALHAPPDLPPGKNPMNGRLGGPQNRSVRFGEEKNFFPLPGFEPRAVEPVTSRYIDHAIPVPKSQREVMVEAKLSQLKP